MGRRLLERDAELSALGTAARAAATGRGSVVLVYGEAGIGKTSLVQALRAHQPAEARILVGACDALATPRTLGPLRDLAQSVTPKLAEALRSGDRDDVISALYDELSSGPATMLVVEDVHWADEATLDTLRFLVRRITELPVVVVLTYRDDEREREHPLSQLLGDLGHGDQVQRLELKRLSEAGVLALTEGSALDAGTIYGLTDGNPYFVTELVASAEDGAVPPTVVDAVLGRLRRLHPTVQNLIEQLAVVPSFVDRALLDVLVPEAHASLSLAEERGLLIVQADGIRFRHELTRRAVTDSLTVARRLELNRVALAALQAAGVSDPSRLVHHAVEAGDFDVVVRLAPGAAREAAASGAHREAAAHYSTALVHGDRYDEQTRVELYEQCAIERYTIGAAPAAVEVQERSIALRRSLGIATELGASLRWLSRMHWFAGHRARAEAAAREATAVLEEAGDPGLLALALSNESQLAMLSCHLHDSIDLARRAIPLARQAGDNRALSHALNNLGSSLMTLGQDGRGELVEAARLALEVDDMENAARAYVNMVWQLLEQFRLDEAERYLGEGLDLSRRAEFIGFFLFMQMERARIELERGHWDAALEIASEQLSTHPPGRCVALTVIGTVLARRGDPRTDEVLAEAAALADDLGELMRTGPAAGARAEAALLRGDVEAAVAIALPSYHEAVRLEDAAISALLACRLHQAGHDVPAPDFGHPYAIQASGRWREAAVAFERIRCPYQQAAALAESPDESDLLDALVILDRLEAQPLARQVRARLRERGARTIPRGPATDTRRNPDGLTDRQLDVLLLLAEGLTNAAIADRLVVSVRTVDSHVAAVLDKLGVSSRQGARDRALELGLTRSR